MDREIGLEPIFDTFEALGRTPGMGHRREDLTPFPVLFWPVGAYLIIYRAVGHPIEIVAVTQGSRDIPAFLRRRIRR
jgi:plasmid stabilization system protein ParE